MDSTVLWKLLLDGMLLVSLAVLCYQMLRLGASDGRSERINRLENTLRSLVQEADSASRSLGEQLSKRQQALEQLLFDIGLIESRVNRLITGAEEKKHELDQQLSRLSQSLKLAEQSAGSGLKNLFETGSRPQSQQADKVMASPESRIEEDFVSIRNYPSSATEVMQPSSANLPRALMRTSLESEVESEILPSRQAATSREVKYAPMAEIRRAASGRVNPNISEFVEQARRKIDEAAESAKVLGRIEQSGRSERLSAAEDAIIEDLEMQLSPRPEDPRLGVLAKMKRETRIL